LGSTIGDDELGRIIWNYDDNGVRMGKDNTGRIGKDNRGR
jgi:hypothetical protein